MVGYRLHHPARPAQTEARTDEDELRARGHEPVHEVLGEAPVYLAGRAHPALRAVSARIVHVHVEAVLV